MDQRLFRIFAIAIFGAFAYMVFVLPQSTIFTAGSSATALRLAASSKPIITTQPTSQSVSVGGTISLAVGASGSQPLSYQWYKGQTLIPGKTASILTILNAQTTDAGSYFVKVSNTGGSTNSKIVQVSVTILKPTITTQPQSQTLATGGTISLSVIATGTALSYQWLKGTVALSGKTTSSLSITNAQIADSGSYTVRVSNAGGIATSSAAVVTVNAAPPPVPIITNQPQSNTPAMTAVSVTFNAGSDYLYIFMDATGTPPLMYQWYQNGTPIPNSNAKNLWYSPATAAQSGEYFVTVKNSVGGTATSSTTTASARYTVPVPNLTPIPGTPTPAPAPTSANLRAPTSVQLPAFFVSTTGDDSAGGEEIATASSTGPFRTLARAVEAARVSSTTKRIYVRAGTYYTGGLTLGSSDNGLQLNAYPGEKPVLSGGTPITNFTNEGSGVWSASVPASITKVGLVTAGGVYHEPARYPNNDDANFATTGWLFSENVILQPGESPHPDWEAFAAYDFTARVGDLSASLFTNEPEPMLFMWDKMGWKSEIYSMTYNATNRQVHVNGRIDFGIDQKTRYYIYNVKAALDRPGEFYFDTAVRKLYIIPNTPGFNASSTVSVAPYDGAPIVRVAGANNIKISGFVLRDQHNTSRWGISEGAAVYMSNGSSGNIIEDNEITATGGGVWVSDTAGANNKIQGNTIHHVLNDAIALFAPQGNSAIGNHISRPGLLERFTKGINSAPVPNRISYNLIENTPHYGINVGADSGNGTIIEYNDVRRTNREAVDCGAVYLKNGAVYNPNNRETVRYNLISDVGGLHVNPNLTFTKDTTCWGIYLDLSGGGGQSGTDVYGNVILNAPTGAVMVHKGTDNKIYNNMFIGSPLVQVYESGAFAANNLLDRNIMVLSSVTSAIVGGTPVLEGTWNNNLYFIQGNSDPVAFFNNTVVTPRGTMPQWKSAGFDSASIVADPQFANVSAGDYTLASSSPAFSLGFTAIPMSQIGLGGYIPQ